MFNIMSFKKCKLKPQIKTTPTRMPTNKKGDNIGKTLGELELPYAI